MHRKFLRYGGPEILFGIALVLAALVWASLLRARAADGAELQCGPGGCAIPQRTAPNVPAPKIGPNKIYPMVGQLRVGSDGRYSYGTGTLVARGKDWGAMLTCGHLFRQMTGPIEVHFPSGEKQPGRLAAMAHGADLALVTTPRPESPPIKIANAKPKVGERLLFCGYDRNTMQLRIQHGVLQHYANEPGHTGGYLLVMSGAAVEGNSGGPVLNLKGELVAVLAMTNGRESIGTHNGRIFKFTANDRFLFPWNADLANAKDARRNPLPQAKAPLVPVQPVPDGRIPDLVSRVGALEAKVGVIEKTQGSPADLARAAAENGAKIAKAAGDAGAALSKVEEVKLGLTGRIREAVVKVAGPLIARFGGWGFGIAGVVVAVGMWLVRKDILDKVRSGDPLVIEKLADRTRNPLDDKLADLIAGAVDRVAKKRGAK